MIECLSVESRNTVNRTKFRWYVEIEDQTSLPSANSETRYGIPEITSLSNHINMSTAGNETVYLYGNNFGTVSNLMSSHNEYAWYGPEDMNYTSYQIDNGCKVVVAHTTIRCTSLGSKNDIKRTAFRWIVQIEDQTSLPSVNNEGQYGVPVVTSLSNHVNISTEGNETVYLYGTNFGPVSVLSNIDVSAAFYWSVIKTSDSNNMMSLSDSERQKMLGASKIAFAWNKIGK